MTPSQKISGFEGLIEANIKPRVVTYYFVTEDDLKNMRGKNILSDIFLLATSILFGAFITTFITRYAAQSLSIKNLYFLEVFQWIFLIFALIFMGFAVGFLISAYNSINNIKKTSLEKDTSIKENYKVNKFIARITPSSVDQGAEYTTKIEFDGKVQNGFFDNYVKHEDSDWNTWNWDRQTLKNSGHTTAGELHGNILIQHAYTFSTKDWPKGKYKIYVRLYDHLVPGEFSRIKIAEEVRDFQVN
jgi:uncharacterized protein YneF (UPF0154 family)